MPTGSSSNSGVDLEGETQVEGPWVDRTVGLNDVRANITMRTPDGHGRVELTKFHTPLAARAEPEFAPANAPGLRRIMFAVEDVYRLCFVCGPARIIIGLAEQLS